MNKTTTNRHEAKYNNYRETIISSRYDGPTYCDGCKTFECYTGECKTYLENLKFETGVDKC